MVKTWVFCFQAAECPRVDHAVAVPRIGVAIRMRRLSITPPARLCCIHPLRRRPAPYWKNSMLRKPPRQTLRRELYRSTVAIVCKLKWETGFLFRWSRFPIFLRSISKTSGDRNGHDPCHGHGPTGDRAQSGREVHPNSLQRTGVHRGAFGLISLF